jgi:flagellin-like protein
MKGVSAVIATILMLMITIALAGTAYLYISGVFGSKTSSAIAFDTTSRCNADSFIVYVRNDGTGVANNINFDITYPDGKTMTSVCTLPQVNAGSTSSANCPRLGKGATAGTYTVAAYSGTSRAVGNIYCSSDSKPSSSVGYWKFDENQGTNMRDSSNNNNGGTDNLESWATGVSGSALSFGNVNNNYVNVPDSSSLKPTMISVSAWVYPTSFVIWDSVVMKASSGAWADGYGLAHYQGTNDINFYINNYNDNHATGTLSLSKWSFVVGTYNGTHIDLYINGVLVNSHPYSAAINNVANPLFIGMGAGGGGTQYLWHGSIDEVQVWNKSLSKNEISELYQS